MSFQYVSDKISHLKRAGLVSATKTGMGLNGGACPDWLVKEQEDRQKRYAKLREEQWLRARRSQLLAAE